MSENQNDTNAMIMPIEPPNNRPLLPPSTCPASRQIEIIPASSTKVLTLLIITFLQIQ